MLVVFGITIKANKKVSRALADLYGIGLNHSARICSELGYSSNLLVSDLVFDQQLALSNKIKNEYIVENSLKELIKRNIGFYISKGCRRGFRHKNQLPVRGQRTHTNAKTVRRNLFGQTYKKKKAKKQC